MFAVDVSVITPQVAAQIGSVVIIGLAVLAVYSALSAFRHLQFGNRRGD